MDKNLKGWFTELSPMWPGQGFSLKVKKIIYREKSKYQDIQIFESANHGRVLVLDGIIQLTENDEASYQEMISLLPLNSHPNPKKVLVIGGGDGGVIREVTKHPKVEEIVHCEIDEQVIEACKEHLPSLAVGFSSPKLKYQCTKDGADFLDTAEDKFDVIITDASDPVVGGENSEVKDGPAVSLFNDDYYTKLKKILNNNGILCCQGENMWLHGDLIARLVKNCKSIFPVVEYAYTCTPTYPSGQIGFILCSTNPQTNFREPVTIISEEEEQDLCYYTSEIHKAAFVLPKFMNKLLQECTVSQEKK